MSTRKKHHYISRGYLKRWSTDDGRVWVYRTLVSHEKVPAWEQKSTAEIGFYTHLYSQNLPAGEDDELERWFDREFESPAEEALQKAVSGRRMTEEDWRRLARFAAAHDLRSPARFERDLARWRRDVPSNLKETMQNLVTGSAENEEAASSALTAQHPEERVIRPSADGFPLKMTIEGVRGSPAAYVRAEVNVGRQFWHYQMRRLLTVTLPKVQVRGWSILEPAEGNEWFTSDHPVIRLNFFNEDNYDFDGGWNRPGSETLFPLSPRHLLYRQAQRHRPSRGTVLAERQTALVRRLIAEHAHRFIVAANPDDSVAALRPRMVDEESFRAEQEKWQHWHEEQSRIERSFWRE